MVNQPRSPGYDAPIRKRREPPVMAVAPPAPPAPPVRDPSYGLVVIQEDRWTPGVEIDLEIRVATRAELESVRAALKQLCLRAFAALEAEEDNP